MSTTRPRSRQSLAASSTGWLLPPCGGQVHLVHAVTAGEFGDGGFHGRGGGIAAGRGAQSLGECAARRVGVGPDDADPRGDEELHHELPDQPEADDQCHLAELRLALADALHRDRPDGAEGRVPRRETVRHRGVEVLRHPVQLGVQRVLVAGAGHEVADLHVVDPGADLLDHPAQGVAQRRVGVQLAHHLAVGGGHPVGGHALHDLGHLVRPGAGLAQHRHPGLGHLHELGPRGDQRVGAADQYTARLAPRHRHVEYRQLAALVVLYNLLHPKSPCSKPSSTPPSERSRRTRRSRRGTSTRGSAHATDAWRSPAARRRPRRPCAPARRGAGARNRRARRR